jgi:low temperature requirement protein LtrA
MSRFQRRREGEQQRATTLELFYDLVFVFAITQVSHLLLQHLTWEGAGQAVLVLLVVWWAWNYTTWVTNELDPDSPVVRLVLIAIMLASLLMAVAIPQAFGDRALLFAGSYVAIQVGRHLFLAFGAGGRGTIERERAVRILVWFGFAGAFWIAGAIAEGTARTVLWLVALAIDYCAPLVTFWLPGRPFPSTAWDVGTAHFAERFQLFVIIALGESIVVTGATTSELDLDLPRVVAFAVAFLSTAALWWLYFNYVAQIAQRRLELAGPGRTQMARDGYTYLHVVLITGVIVSAVGDELVIAHPTEVLPGREVTALVAGPAIYLLGHALFRLRMSGSLSRKRLGGALACVAAGGVGAFAPALAVAALLLAILIAVIASERIAGLRRARRGEPAPLERLDEAP